MHKKILISPLDWGLGHATRCIPLIRMMQAHGLEVIVAGSGSSGTLLKQVFPDLLHLNVPSFTFTYTRVPGLFPFQIIRQLPRFIQQTQQEQQWLLEQQKAHQFHAVISDNRFGMYHANIPSIFITHQLGLKTGLGSWVDGQVQKVKYNKLKRFTTCWVPDVRENDNLAGALSHPSRMPDIPVEYIGWLSGVDQTDLKEKENHLLILLSGPEPSRTQLEIQLKNELKDYAYPVSFVRGLPQHNDNPLRKGNVTFYNSVSREQLSALTSEADCVICRSGYSSVMDMVHLRKKAVFIPTPGQPEQEYLARHLLDSKIAPFLIQKDFNVAEALKLRSQFPYQLSKNTSCNEPTFIQYLDRVL